MSAPPARGSKEAWLSAAYDALIDGGIDAVKIMPLAQRLGLSRTSFYWFFKDRRALLTALADQWRERTTDALVAAAGAYADNEAEAMLNVIACFIDETVFDARFEFAIRSWALRDGWITQRIEEGDTLRLAALEQMMRRWGHTGENATVRARTVYLVQIGYISMRSHETTAVRLRRAPEYVEIYTGKRPEPQTLARFYAMFGEEAADLAIAPPAASDRPAGDPTPVAQTPSGHGT